jgi:hypothetical protein
MPPELAPLLYTTAPSPGYVPGGPGVAPYYGPSGEAINVFGQPFGQAKIGAGFAAPPTRPRPDIHPYVPGEKDYAPGAGPPAPAGAAQIGHATESIQTASISVGAASISGVSMPALPAGVPGGASGSGGVGSGFRSRQAGGPITEDELSKLHKGEYVVPADDVKNAGGHANVKAAIEQGLAPPTGGIDGDTGKSIADTIEAARTAGFIPTGAGSKSVAGTSFVAGILNLGNEAVAGLIDTGAAAAQTAISMAGNVGAPGAGAAAGAIGGIGIQLAASEGKRAASYGFQMASILADSVIDQVFGPFGGPPRWLGYDYTQFVPHINIGAIGTTTVEKAAQALQQQGKPGAPGAAQPGGPVAPEHLPGEQPVGPPVPKFGQPTPPQALGAGGPEAGGPPPPPDTGAPPPGPPPEAVAAPGTMAAPPTAPPLGGLDIHNLLGFDEGGWLMPGQPGLNTTNRPELVLSPQQLDAMQTSANGNPWRGGDTFHITTIDAEGVGREIDKRKRLAMMQYGGRP